MFRKCSCKKYIVVLIAILFLIIPFLPSISCAKKNSIPQTRYYLREGLNSTIQEAIDDYCKSLPDIMRKKRIPGCAIALIDNDGPIWIQGFGYANIKQRLQVTGDTYFNVGSVSKTITATAIMVAVQDGLLDLDEPISTYLPDFEMRSKYDDNPEDKITLRHLLQHTAGITREIPIGDLSQFSGGLFEDGFVHPVGQQWDYSNTGIDLAAYVLQRVSGLPFEQYLKEHLFIPLGMHHSTVGWTDWSNLSDDEKAYGYVPGFFHLKHPVYDFGPPVAAGGIFISVSDLAKFVQFHLDRGKWNGRQILNESLLDEMYKPANQLNEFQIYYGLGIYIKHKTPGRPYNTSLSHEGTWIGGFTAGICWLPEDHIGIVVLTNVYNDSEPLNFVTLTKQKLAEHDIVKTYHDD
jgi:CubicO group peptidase (beta-lactamase class C family)